MTTSTNDRGANQHHHHHDAANDWSVDGEQLKIAIRPVTSITRPTSAAIIASGARAIIGKHGPSTLPER